MQIEGNANEGLSFTSDEQEDKRASSGSFFDSLLKDLSSEYTYKNAFPRLTNYENKKLVQTHFSSLTSVNSSKFSPFDFTEFDLFIADFENLDDLHKAIKYGLINFDEQTNEYLNSVFSRNQATQKKTLIAAKIKGENKFLGLAVISKEFDPKLNYGVW